MTPTRRTAPDLMADYFEAIADVEGYDSIEQIEALQDRVVTTQWIIDAMMDLDGNGSQWVADLDSLNAAANEALDKMRDLHLLDALMAETMQTLEWCRRLENKPDLHRPEVIN